MCGESIDIVAAHLPHDVCNHEAASHKPSKFASSRGEMLRAIVDKTGLTREGKAIVLGDFNFRLDLKDVVEQCSVEVQKPLKYPALYSSFAS